MYWRDMLRFKASGISTFDFGGYYLGSDDEEKLRINGFKEEFGGRVIQEFNCEKALTLKGELASLGIRKRAEWAMRRRARAPQVAVEENESPLSASV
jgi:lipid II:glycine glycyltransferase (peptidoglycan interpeptide bridge formation enzyme)